MQKIPLIKITILLFFLIQAQGIYAADSLAGKYPRAVLIQLRSERNRTEAMIKARDFAALEDVRKDAAEVIKSMKNDFATNFHYCPVYYYTDTNADLVKSKVFEGILFNADNSPVTTSTVNNIRDYVVVYYGYPLSQTKSTGVVTDSDRYIYDPESRPGKGLVILNEKFQQISYVSKMGYADMMLGNKKKRKDYYASKRYDIDYFPLAKLFNQRLYDRGRTEQIKSAVYKGQ